MSKQSTRYNTYIILLIQGDSNYNVKIYRQKCRAAKITLMVFFYLFTLTEKAGK